MSAESQPSIQHPFLALEIATTRWVGVQERIREFTKDQYIIEQLAYTTVLDNYVFEERNGKPPLIEAKPKAKSVEQAVPSILGQLALRLAGYVVYGPRTSEDEYLFDHGLPPIVETQIPQEGSALALFHTAYGERCQVYGHKGDEYVEIILMKPTIKHDIPYYRVDVAYHTIAPKTQQKKGYAVWLEDVTADDSGYLNPKIRGVKSRWARADSAERARTEICLASMTQLIIELLILRDEYAQVFEEKGLERLY